MSVTGMDAATLAALHLVPDEVHAELLSGLVLKHVKLSAAETELATLSTQFEAGQAEINHLSGAASDLQNLERDFDDIDAFVVQRKRGNQSLPSMA